MPALNHTVFIDKILSREKNQTIRPKRKRPIKPGDRLYHYTRMRHKDCRKLGESACSKTNIIIFTNNNSWDVFLDGVSVYGSRLHDLALADGFSDLYEFISFFVKTHKIPVGGRKEFDLIKWQDFKRMPI